MAAVPATILAVEPVRGADEASGSGGADTAHTRLARFLITFHHGTTEVAGGTDTLDVDVATVIPAWLRNGGTYALRHVCLEQAALKVDADGAQAAVTATLGTSSNTVQLTPKSAADGSTNATLAATDRLARPYRVFVVVSGG